MEATRERSNTTRCRLFFAERGQSHRHRETAHATGTSTALKLNAMTYGEHYDVVHDLIEAFFGFDEDEAFDNNYAGLDIGLDWCRVPTRMQRHQGE